MLALAFRDMAVNQCGGVTPANACDLSPAFGGRRWWPPPASFTELDLHAVGQSLRGKHVCFTVHGFNVDRDDGATGFGTHAQECGLGGALLSLTPQVNLYTAGVDIVIPVLWAGDWYLPINYPFLLPDIRLTGKYFADLITSGIWPIHEISFLTHSMGVRVVMETIQQATQMATTAGKRLPRINTAIFTAPAVSDQIFDDPDYADSVNIVRNFVVVSSKADTILSQAFPAGNAVEQQLWANDPGADEALGRYGPRVQQGSKALGKIQWYEIPLPTDPNDPGQNHGDYFPTPSAPVPPYPNGWSSKRVKIGQLSQTLLNGQKPAWPPEKLVAPW